MTLLAQKRAAAAGALNNARRADELEAFLKKHKVNTDDYEDDSAMFEPVKDTLGLYVELVQFVGFIHQMNIQTGTKLKDVNNRDTDAIAHQAVPGASVEIYFIKQSDSGRWCIAPAVH